MRINIEEIVLPEEAVNEGYWVKDISRASNDSLENTTVIIFYGIDKAATVTFNKFAVEVRGGEFEKYQEEIGERYREKLFEASPELQEHYDAVMGDIEVRASIYRQTLINEVNEKGFLITEEMNKLAEKQSSIGAKLYSKCHGENLAPLMNRHNRANRVINIGEIYSADLNPALKEEISGKRPVLVIGEIDDKFLVIPTSTTAVNSTYEVLSKEESGLEKDSKLQFAGVRTVHKSRLFAKIGKLDETRLDEIRSKLVKTILGEEKYAALTTSGIMDIEMDADDLLEDLFGKKGGVVSPQTMKDCETTLSTYKKRDMLDVKFSNQPQEKIVKPTPTTVFELTDEEIMKIAYRKIDIMHANGSRLQFENPRVEGQDLGTGINLIFDTKYFPVKFSFAPFTAHTSSGDKHIPNDPQLIMGLAKTLHEKYGEAYDRIYVKQKVDFYNTKFNKGWTLERCCERLDLELSFIGKRAKNTNMLVVDGLNELCYEELENIPIEDQNF